LNSLEFALSSTEGAEFTYDWILLELLDQMVRDTSGGDMEQFLKKCPEHSRKFIASRIGKEAERFWVSGQKQRSIITQLSEMSLSWFTDRIRFYLISCFAWLLGGKQGIRSVKEGWFRTAGEVHRWMYDRYSLGRLLSEADFIEIAACAPDVSRIPGFAAYELDVINGEVRKPDSLFMEGVRP
jgi:hypothetical protein